jgi:hypothetical protein
VLTFGLDPDWEGWRRPYFSHVCDILRDTIPVHSFLVDSSSIMGRNCEIVGLAVLGITDSQRHFHHSGINLTDHMLQSKE